MDDVAADTLIRFARVTAVNLGAATCSVEVADGVTFDDLPWLERRMGDTRSWCPPSIGEQVLLLAPEGDIGLAIVVGGIASDARPDIGSDRTVRVEHADGAKFSYDPEAHTLTATLPSGSTIDVTADTVRIKGNVEITGDVDVTGTVTATTDVIGGGKSLKSHKHSGVQAGSAQSGPPA